jgi:hypothetical protein
MTAAITNSARWTRRAPCRGRGDLFFPEGEGRHVRHRTEQAKRFCAGCPFKSPCLELALDAEGGAAGHARYGVYGARTPEERREIWEERQRSAELLAAAS